MVDRGLAIERMGAVVELTLSRPEALNALDPALVAALGEQLTAIAGDPELRVVVLAGAGRCFCAGADLKEIGGLAPAAFQRYIRALEGVCEALEEMPQPVIAAVHGVAYGGGFELALACDLRVADDSTRFGLPEVKLGVLPGAGGMQRAARLLPLGVARRLALTGESLAAAEAHRFGLIEEPADAGGAREAAHRLATSLAEGPPLAHAAAKQVLLRGTALDVQAAVALEQQAVTALWGTRDREEGTRAFLEKRLPKFSGS